MKVITTVGMSIYNNASYLADSVHKNWKTLSDKYAKYSSIGTIKNAIKKEWSSNPNTSAEIASLIQIQQELKCPIEVYLIATETIHSHLCAELIRDWFEEFPQQHITAKSIQIKVITSLLVSTKVIFKTGLSKLFKVIDEEIVIKDKNNKRQWNEIAFNITGGYKAIIPHLTIMAQIYRCPMYYVFDENREDDLKYELIKIPALPINFDWLVSEIYGHFLSSDTMLTKSLTNNDDKIKLLGYGLIKEDNTRDVFGELLWQYINSKSPESPSVMGLFVEYKVYEYFNENRGDYSELPKRGISFYWEDKSKTKICLEDKKFGRIAEIDLKLTNYCSKYAIVEVKTIKQLKTLLEEKGTEKQPDILNKIMTCEKYYGQLPSEFIVIVHKNSKFSFDLNEHKGDLEKMEEFAKKVNVKFKVFLVDFDVNKDNESLNFSNFLNKPFGELMPIFSTSQCQTTPTKPLSPN